MFIVAMATKRRLTGYLKTEQFCRELFLPQFISQICFSHHQKCNKEKTEEHITVEWYMWNFFLLRGDMEIALVVELLSKLLQQKSNSLPKMENMLLIPLRKNIQCIQPTNLLGECLSKYRLQLIIAFCNYYRYFYKYSLKKLQKIMITPESLDMEDLAAWKYLNAEEDCNTISKILLERLIYKVLQSFGEKKLSLQLDLKPIFSLDILLLKCDDFPKQDEVIRKIIAYFKQNPYELSSKELGEIDKLQEWIEKQKKLSCNVLRDYTARLEIPNVPSVIICHHTMQFFKLEELYLGYLAASENRRQLVTFCVNFGLLMMRQLLVNEINKLII